MFSLTIGCTPDPITIELENHQSKLVVSAQIIPDQYMFVSLTKSFSALSDANTLSQEFLDQTLVENAFVTVSYLNEIDTLSMVAPGIYGSDSTLQYDYGTYTLYARDVESGMEVLATESINPLVVFDTISPFLDKTTSDTMVYIDFSFTDISGIDNWYVINYYKKLDTIQETSLDINNYFNRGTNQLNEFELVSDKTIEGGIYHSRKLLNVNPNDTIAVTLSNISEGYFRFLHTYLKAGDAVNQISGEPINYPTNVTNGYGYFSAHYPDAHIFYLKDY